MSDEDRGGTCAAPQHAAATSPADDRPSRETAAGSEVRGNTTERPGKPSRGAPSVDPKTRRHASYQIMYLIDLWTRFQLAKTPSERRYSSSAGGALTYPPAMESPIRDLRSKKVKGGMPSACGRRPLPDEKKDIIVKWSGLRKKYSQGRSEEDAVDRGRPCHVVLS